MPKVLIIDDDVGLSQAVSEYLVKYGFTVECRPTAAEGLDALVRRPADIVLLDVGLPDRSGFEVCKDIRARSEVPVIMFTARGDTTDRIVGLELGADDYLPKPVDPRELVARIQTVLRRVKSDEKLPEHVLNFGDLTIDTATRSAVFRGKDLGLSTVEFDVLSVMAKNSGRTLAREEIAKLLGIEKSRERAIDVTISRLRSRLKEHPEKPKFIRTVWGTGYVFVAKRL